MGKGGEQGVTVAPLAGVLKASSSLSLGPELGVPLKPAVILLVGLFSVLRHSPL